MTTLTPGEPAMKTSPQPLGSSHRAARSIQQAVCWGVLFGCGLWAMPTRCLLAAERTVLFQGSLGTLPTAQGWPYFTNPLFGPLATQTAEAGSVLLDTLGNPSEQAGYFSRDPVFGIFQHPQMPVLDRSTGFTVDVKLQVLQEVHAARDDNGDGQFDRAGFSVIALAQDRHGLELAFWQDRLWAYAGDERGSLHRFTQAESAPIDLSQMVALHVSFLAGQYYVHVADQLLLQGPVRNYQFFSGSPDVYEQPNFLFWGDDTSSAASKVRIAEVAIWTNLRSSLCDLNLDQSVDAADAGLLFSDWAGRGMGDLNEDQITDAADAGICFGDWTGDTFALPEPGLPLAGLPLLLTPALTILRRRNSSRKN